MISPYLQADPRKLEEVRDRYQHRAECATGDELIECRAKVAILNEFIRRRYWSPEELTAMGYQAEVSDVF
jgi:hypothetical protein